MASQSADTGGDRNQVHPLRSPVPSIRGTTTSRRLTFQRPSLAAVSGQRRHKHPMKSHGVCVLMIVAARFADPIVSPTPYQFASDTLRIPDLTWYFAFRDRN